MYIWINGKFYSENEAKISVFDHGFLYGDGIFETLRVYNGKIFLLNEHLQRLQNSARLISLLIPNNTYFEKIVYSCLNKNKLRNAYVRLSVSRGVGKIGLSPQLCEKPTVVVIVQPSNTYPEKMYQEGVTIKIVKTRRVHSLCLPVEAKTTNFLNNIMARMESIPKSVVRGFSLVLNETTTKGSYYVNLEEQAFEAVMLNLDGFVTEGSVSNIFMVKNSILYTSSLKCGLLPGVTRDYVIKLAKKLKIKVFETKLKPRDFYFADECFLTNTSLEIMPVKQIDNHVIGNGISDFTVTAKLRKIF